MSLFFVFGTPGVGKSFVGRILKNDFGFTHYDADEDLTEDMIQFIKQERVFTESMRKNYFNLVINKTKDLLTQHQNIIVSQALIKENNRLQVLAEIPATKFIHVVADVDKINNRLRIRNNWVSKEYAAKIRTEFETPKLTHLKVDNNRNAAHIRKQLETGLL